MSLVLAFDVYGTLIDPHGVVSELKAVLGERADQFSQRWRDKQLEYSFRRSLMGDFVDFAQCTREALEFTDRALKTRLEEGHKDRLLASYTRLPAFEEVAGAIDALHESKIRCVAFSNGGREAVEGLLDQAGVLARFDDIVSAEEIKRFKPDPAIYAHLRARLETAAEETWLVSSNPFDVIGAKHAGLKAVWIRRSAEAPFDPWGGEPDLIVSDLAELAERFG